jgi:hypothetical protein
VAGQVTMQCNKSHRLHTADAHPSAGHFEGLPLLYPAGNPLNYRRG